jgi:Vacuolar sorting protein 9 (VPS9) domain
MNVFGEVTHIIKQEISEFWQGVNVQSDKLSLDGDQILMLYVYIAAQAKIKNIFAHLEFCKEFSTPYI